jgi:hypothetical protein
MCVTAHYIDANFVLKKKIISFKDVKYPHTKEAIEEALSRCLADWGIKHKLFTITLDNAANNTGAVTTFLKTQDHGLLLDGAHFHIRCCAHILNLVVQDGTTHMRDAIEKIRDLGYLATMEVKPTLLDMIREAQKKDSDLEEIRGNMVKGKAEGFCEDEMGTLWFEQRLCVPNDPEIKKLIL